MIGRTVAFVACVFGFAALVVPREGEEEVAKIEQVRSETRTPWSKSPNPAPKQASSDWYAGDHTLQREGDGHFYANATVGGASMRMMVDTGASVIALTGSDARAAGLSWEDSEVRMIGRGASGDVFGVARKLSEVEIGGIVRRNVSAVIIPEGLDISLLGQSYLSKVGDVNISGDKMVLGGE
ncbi:MAG: TIGR02281 family clan AA aspartic protease [Erythrobacter sp.]